MASSSRWERSPHLCATTAPRRRARPAAEGAGLDGADLPDPSRYASVPPAAQRDLVRDHAGIRSSLAEAQCVERLADDRVGAEPDAPALGRGELVPADQYGAASGVGPCQHLPVPARLRGPAVVEENESEVRRSARS